MAFKKRKADRRKLDAPILSGVAEVCETRALLSADGVCLPAADADAVLIEDIESEDTQETVDAEQFADGVADFPELAICTLMPLMEGEVAEEGEGIAEEFVDPSLMFYSFVAAGGGEDEFGENIEITTCEEVVDENVLINETPVYKGEAEEGTVTEEGEVFVTAIGEFDPSWVVRSFVATGEGESSDAEDGEIVLNDVVEDVVVDEECVDVTTLEDYDPSWTYRTFVSDVPEDGGEVADEVSDCEVKVQFWHDLAPGTEEEIIVDDSDVDVTTLEDYDPSWAYRGTTVDGNGEVIDDGDVVVDDEVVIVDDEVVIEDGEVVYFEDGVPQDGENIPVRYYFGMNYRGDSGGEIPVEVLAMSSGAPTTDSAVTVMGPVAAATSVVAPVVNVPVINQPVSLPVVSTTPLAIPVISNSVASLFSDEEEVLVTNLTPLVAESNPLASVIEESHSVLLSSELGYAFGSDNDESLSSVGELTPLLEEEQEEEEDPTAAPSVEELPVETEEPVNSVKVVQPPVVIVAGRANYGRSIDEVMSEFATSGFAG